MLEMNSVREALTDAITWTPDIDSGFGYFLTEQDAEFLDAEGVVLTFGTNLLGKHQLGMTMQAEVLPRKHIQQNTRNRRRESSGGSRHGSVVRETPQSWYGAC